MPSNEDPIVIPVEADFAGFETAMNALEKSSLRFSRSFTTAIKSMIRDGTSFEDTLKGLALRMSDIALQSSLKPVENALSGVLRSVTSSVGSSVIGSTGSAFDIGKFVAPIGAALFAPVGSSAVSKTATGFASLAKQTSASVAPNVTFNISTPDADSFKKSQTQISTMLARSVSRSRRGN